MLQPIEGKILVEELEKKETLGDTTILLPGAAQEAESGVGIAITGEYKGKKVYYKKYTDTKVEYNDKVYYIVDEEDILAYENGTK